MYWKHQYLSFACLRNLREQIQKFKRFLLRYPTPIDGMLLLVFDLTEDHGVMGNIKTSFAENTNFLNIKCEKGLIEMAPFSAYSGNKGKSPLGEINFPYQVPWQQANQMDMDSLAIMGGKPMAVPGEEGLRDIRIVNAILESAKTGNKVMI